MKSGLGRSCSGNFLAIFAGTVLDEKLNFLSRIFGRGRPFDKSTRYEDANGTAYFVLIIAHLDGENSVYHIYRAEATNGIESAEFVEIGNFTFDKDFQGFGLVTEAETNKIYMIGLWSPSEGATFADYAYLYQLDTASWSLSEELQQIHLTSIGGGIGVLGVHFRYGASVLVKDDGSLVLSATERNSVLGSGLAVNEWAA